MRLTRRCCLLGLLALFLPARPAPGPAAESAPAVELKVVKYDGLADTVRRLRGKVVVVDFWGNTCQPCKKNFPHLVEMQRKYAADGLAAVSVCVTFDEDADLAKERADALKFLQAKDATFTNLFLDEKADVLKERLRIKSIPNVYVFNREGKWYQFKSEVDYGSVERKAVELLRAK
jgi:thiol-disulfide isomerase/thioredoxin